MDDRSLTSFVRHYANVVLAYGAEARARSYTSDQAAEVQALDARAARRVGATRTLTSPRDVPIAAALYREAIELRLRAANVGRSEGAVTLDDRARTLVDTDFDREPPDACRDAVVSLARLERRLRSLAEPRTVTAIRGVRFGRIASVFVVLAYVSYTAITQALSPPNVAFHKPLTVSGVPVGNASDLVDGVVDALKPVRLVGASPTVDIDFGGEYRLDSIRITNRQDEHFDASLPITVSTARVDGEWSELVVQRIHFRTVSLSAEGRTARYVRVATGAHELGLNEIQVFGRYAR